MMENFCVFQSYNISQRISTMFKWQALCCSKYVSLCSYQDATTHRIFYIILSSARNHHHYKSKGACVFLVIEEMKLNKNYVHLHGHGC